MVEDFAKSGLIPAKQVANILYVAVHFNTLNFKASVSTARDKKASDWLERNCEVEKDLVREAYSFKKEYVLKAPEKLVEDLKDGYRLGNLRVGIAQTELYGAKEALAMVDEISKALRKIKNERHLDVLFLNLIDVKNGVSYFITPDEKSSKLLLARLSCKPQGKNLFKHELALRKELEVMLNLSVKKL